jgi:hypothetical protein
LRPKSAQPCRNRSNLPSSLPCKQLFQLLATGDQPAAVLVEDLKGQGIVIADFIQAPHQSLKIDGLFAERQVIITPALAIAEMQIADALAKFLHQLLQAVALAIIDMRIAAVKGQFQRRNDLKNLGKILGEKGRVISSSFLRLP